MFKMEFTTDNASFEVKPQAEALRILLDISLKVMKAGKKADSGKIMDTNGNSIGTWEWNPTE
jgi:hypothetical protein